MEERIGDVSTGLSEDSIFKLMKQRKHLTVAPNPPDLEPCCICQVWAISISTLCARIFFLNLLNRYISTFCFPFHLLSRLPSWIAVILFTLLEPLWQEEYADGDGLGTLDCGHDFHTDCIKQWLMQKNLCPICKTTALLTWEGWWHCLIREMIISLHMNQQTHNWVDNNLNIPFFLNAVFLFTNCIWRRKGVVICKRGKKMLL